MSITSTKDISFATLVRNTCAHMSWQERAQMRIPTFVLSTLANSDVNAIHTLSKLADSAQGIDARTKHFFKSPRLVRQLFAASKFLGYGLNDYVGDQTPEQLLTELQSVGGDYSKITLNAIKNERHNCKVKFPDTFETLERYGIVSTADYFAFVNLFTKLECDMAKEGVLINQLRKDPERNREAICEARERLIDINYDQTGLINAAFSYMLGSKQPFLVVPEGTSPEDTSHVADLEKLRQTFPHEFLTGRAGQKETTLSYSFSRIMKEILMSSVEPDPVILELERKGLYTDEFKKELLALALENTGKHSIALHKLPVPMREALEEIYKEVKSDSKELAAGPVRKAGYRTYAYMERKGGGINWYVNDLAKGLPRVGPCSVKGFDADAYVLQLQEKLCKDNLKIKNSRTIKWPRSQVLTPYAPGRG